MVIYEKKSYFALCFDFGNMNSIAELHIKDFRAIKQADIHINGITVVSGINGSGKSTLSKLLYYAFRNANSFEELTLHSLNTQLRPYLNVLEQLSSIYIHYPRYFHISGTSSRVSNRRVLRRDYTLSSISETSFYIEEIRELCNRFVELDSLMKAEGSSAMSERLNMILRSTLKNTDPKQTLKHLLDELVHRIHEHIQKAEVMLAERPYRILRNSIESSFDASIPKNIVLQEYGDYILGEKITNVPLPHYIKKVVYIDTPMVIGMETYPGQPSYWKELNDLLKLPPRRGYKRTINNFIKEEILKGDASFDYDLFSGGFKYKRLDGKEFDLLECATGIKSFSLLQMLLKNLYLDENTLLIIDAPEAHLHPQWIVEYARLIILLHKKLGVKFFIASHSTDMVSAIRYISEKDKCLSSVSFYVAEEDTNKKDSYIFKSLGHDIEPIFESFNKSFKALDKYVE